MKTLTDEELLYLLHVARIQQLEPEFIQLIQNEINRRKLKADLIGGAQCVSEP